MYKVDLYTMSTVIVSFSFLKKYFLLYAILIFVIKYPLIRVIAAVKQGPINFLLTVSLLIPTCYDFQLSRVPFTVIQYNTSNPLIYVNILLQLEEYQTTLSAISIHENSNLH